MIYIRMRNRVQVKQNQNLKIKDIARIIGKDEIVKKLEDKNLLTVKKEDRNIIIIDLVHMIETIQAIDQSLEIQTFGPAQTIVEVIYDKKKVTFLSFAAVWLLLFIRCCNDNYEFSCRREHERGTSKVVYHHHR